MSVASVTALAVQRRDDDLGRQGGPPARLRELAAATEQEEKTENSATAVLKSIATYIPTELLALYLAAIAAVRSTASVSKVSSAVAQRTGSAVRASDGEITLLIIFAVLTPVMVWLVYAGRVKTGGKALPISPRKWPIWEMTAALFAFVAWSFAIPETPFTRFSWYSLAWATFVVLAVSTFLGLIAPLVTKRELKS